MKRAYIPKGQRNDWCTPGDVLDVVRDAFGGSIDLDPCSNPASITMAAREIWETDYPEASRKDSVEIGNGLALVWHGRTFVNPPFDNLGAWIQKCAQEGRPRRAEVILLCPSRTDTIAWQALAPTVDALCFWKGRIKFLGSLYGAPFPTALLYWGTNPSMFARAFRPKGIIFKP